MRLGEVRAKVEKIRRIIEKNPYMSDTRIAEMTAVSRPMVIGVRARMFGPIEKVDMEFFTPEELTRLDDWLRVRGLLEPLTGGKDGVLAHSESV